MNKNLTPEQICFNLFVDAVKKRDSRQFGYFSLYANIAHNEDILVETNTQGEEFTL